MDVTQTTVMVTGGAGFIGSNFVRHALARWPGCRVVNFDKLTYAGNLENLRDVESDPRYRFVRGDVCDRDAVRTAMAGAGAVVHFAAESHVDRSIDDPFVFTRTNVIGTHVMLECARELGVPTFLQIGTDEVYGSVEQGSSVETDKLDPRSPYSSSKAAADLLALSYHATYGMDVRVTRCTNNYGPYQYPEKLIPFFVTSALAGRQLPIYGDGRNVRDWLYVEDHCDAVAFVLERGQAGEIYNIGGGREMMNIEITDLILKELGKPSSLKTYVTDRPGHDRRYSLDISKIKRLGWSPRHTFEQAAARTIAWYVANEQWWRHIQSGEYRQYVEKMYGRRLADAT